MIKILFGHKYYLCFIIVLMIIEPSINSILNFWLQKLFNSATVGADVVYVLRLLTAGFLLWMFKRIITYVMLIVRDRFICNVKGDIKHDMFTAILSVDTANISPNASIGEHISMFTNDILLLEQRFLTQIMGLFSNIFSIVILGYSFVILSPKLACSIIVFGFLTMFVPAIFSKKLNAKNLIYTKKVAHFTQKLKEYISSFPTIKNYAIESEISKRFYKENIDAENSKFESDSAFTLANSIGQLLAWFMQFIGVGFGIVLVVKGEIVIGTVIAAQAFAGDLALPIQNIVININSIRSVKSIISKLENFTDSYDEKVISVDNNITTKKDNIENAKNDQKYDIEFDSMSLKIGDKTIIDNFSYRFENGKKYLIIGINGSGKSSIFKVLKKWYKNSSGKILINGIPLSCYSNEQLSNIVSYLNETVSLFSGTLQENITLFQNYDKADLQKAVDNAHIKLDINREIDEGKNVSSGEQRRIEIARSLLKSAPIIIFDEVVSTLDIETAYEIEKSAMDLTDKTVIFISHNFSGKLIKFYDEILLLDNGKIVAHGTYDELMKISPYFQKICNIKFGMEG